MASRMRRLSRRIVSIPRSPHRVLVALVEELRRKGVDVYNYTAGQPGLPPSEKALRYFFEKFMEDPFGHSRYVATQGLWELREEISRDLEKYSGVRVDPRNIVITSGGAEGLLLALGTVVEPGDEVLVFDPCYSLYWGLLRYLGAKIVTCRQDIERGFQPDPECIKEKVSDRTAAILLTSPDNPTSRIVSREVVETIIDVAVKHKVWVVYDEAYKHIVYEGEHVWLLRYPELQDLLIGVNSFSKDLAIPGFRLGYLYGPSDFIEQAVKMKGFLSITSPVPAQFLALYYLREGFKEEYLRYALEVYRRRRDAAYNAFRKYLPEARVLKPTASMYLFPDMRPYLERLGVDDVQFTYDLAKEVGVAMLPGSAFGEGGKGYLRVTFVTQPEDRLVRGIELLAEYIERRAQR